ncbi:MAG: ABC transporter substrate-binding protein [Gemmatimonadota bacterium]
MFASGADLQSVNPLLTVHPLARQVQRYVLLTTLVRYDSALAVQPYLARAFEWSPDRKVITFHLSTRVRWGDGATTTAGDAAWTLRTALDPRTGYPRRNDLMGIDTILARDDSTLVLRFTAARSNVPDVLTDLAILPAHIFERIPVENLRTAEWNEHPVGNGPFRFVSHEANRRWVFEANPDFPPELGGPPALARFVVAVVDEPTTKLAALASGELDFAGINPAHAAFVRSDPDLAVISYPLLLTYGIVFNTRVPPFDDLHLRRLVSASLDRGEIVDGYLYGFGAVATGPVLPDLPGYIPTDLSALATGPGSTRGADGRVTLELLTVGSGEAALEQMIQAQLARVGITVTIRQLELTAFLNRVNSRHPDFQAAVMGTAGDLGMGQLTTLGELTGLAVPADPALAQNMFDDSLPVAFLYHARGVQGMNRRVKNVTMDIRGELASVHEWSVSRPSQ